MLPKNDYAVSSSQVWWHVVAFDAVAEREDSAHRGCRDPHDAPTDVVSEPAPSLPIHFAKPQLLVGALSKLRAIGDFEILGLLGEGAFGKVFRARQISLERQVALKVTANLGHEARTMARLEHPRVVQVFSESVDAEGNLRLLCMQFVAGATLQQVIVQLQRCDESQWSGRTIVETLDALSLEQASLDPASLRDRETLAGCRHDEAVCWIGQQLAETLAYAHSQGVLHLDIKPGNVLLNQYGQPMLTDFSVSLAADAMSHAGAAVLGGTLGYMAPEHLSVFHPNGPAAPETVDERSDIYSLGAVLLDYLLVRTKLLAATTEITSSGRLGIIAATRDLQSVAESLRQRRAPLPLVFTVCRCLQNDPDERYQSAGELAASLEGCRELLRAARSLPTERRGLTRLAVTRPLLFTLLFTILPNIAASALNLAYLGLLVIGELSPEQRGAFWQIVLAYNAAVIAVMVVAVDRTLLAVARDWRRLHATNIPADADIVDVRRRTLALPAWVVVLTCVGWLPLVPVIPLGMEFLAGPIDRGVLWHISVAYFLTGMIALVCDYFGVCFVVLRSLYSRQWGNTAHFRQTVARELGHLPRRNRAFQIVAGLTPLTAAGLLVVVGPEQFTPEGFQRFRSLVFVLLVTSVAGSWLANLAASSVNQYIEVLTLARGEK